MPLLLTPRVAAPSPLAIDLSGILPHRVAPLSLREVAGLTVTADGHAHRLGDLFTVAGDPSDHVIECRGDFSRVHAIAAGMTAGHVRVLGGAGRHAGAGMTGGRLDIAGDAGDWLACELAGGDVCVAGAAGDNVAAALPGSVAGMRGGRVLVAGRVGHLLAARLRRGVVAVGGGCGTGAGFELRAGTVLVAGDVAGQPGLGMRRGSVIALDTPPDPPATFRRGVAWQPPFLRLLFRSLAAAGFPAAGGVRPGNWRQWHGDALAGGRGELLHPA